MADFVRQCVLSLITPKGRNEAKKMAKMPRMVAQAVYCTIEYSVPLPDVKSAKAFLKAFKAADWGTIEILDMWDDSNTNLIEFSELTDEKIDILVNDHADLFTTIDHPAVEEYDYINCRLFNAVSKLGGLK